MFTDSQPHFTLNSNIPLLPATTLTRPAAPAAPKMGDTITFTDKRGDIKTGVIEAISIKSVEKRIEYLTHVNGFTYAVRSEQILPAKMPAESPVMDADTAPVGQTQDDLYNEVKQAEEIYIQYMRMDTFDLPADHATYKRKVAAHITFLRAQAAYTGLSNDHLIAYLYGKGAVTKTAPQSPQTPVSSASQDSQTPTIETAREWPEIAPVMPVEGDTPRLFAPYKPIEQDPLILAAKRQAQYEAAKARVEAHSGVYQAPVRKEIVMHSNEDWRAMLGNVGGGA